MTAVELLVSKIASKIDDEYWCNQQNITKYVEQAKEMEEKRNENPYSRKDVLNILDNFLESMLKGEQTGLIEKWFDEKYGSNGSGSHIVYNNEIKKLIKQAHFDGQYLHSNSSKLLTKEMLDENAEYYSNAIIQSLKSITLK